MVLREFYDSMPSTQDRALELARRGAAEGTRVVARRQRSGRGRHDRAWESPEGGLYLSIVLEVPEERLVSFPVVLGAAIADSLGRHYDVPLRLRWPNDLVVGETPGPPRKLGGVLVDRVRSPPLPRATVAGIGVNVATDLAAFPADLRSRVAVLSEFRPTLPSLDEVETVVVEAALRAASDLRDAGGLAGLVARARRLLWGVHLPATIDGRPVGLISGLGDEGELWVENGGVRKAIWAGELGADESA